MSCSELQCVAAVCCSTYQVHGSPILGAFHSGMCCSALHFVAVRTEHIVNSSKQLKVGSRSRTYRTLWCVHKNVHTHPPSPPPCPPPPPPPNTHKQNSGGGAGTHSYACILQACKQIVIIYTCGMTYSYVWCDPFICMCIYKCAHLTLSYVLFVECVSSHMSHIPYACMYTNVRICHHVRRMSHNPVTSNMIHIPDASSWSSHIPRRVG